MTRGQGGEGCVCVLWFWGGRAKNEKEHTQLGGAFLPLLGSHRQTRTDQRGGSAPGLEKRFPAELSFSTFFC